MKTKKRGGKTVAQGESKQDYETPWSHVRAVEEDSFGGERFALDAAASPENAKAQRFYTPLENGLASPWADRTWINPTYENQDRWLARAVYFAREHGFRSAALVLASTSALYWRRLTFEAGTVDLYEGRIAFVDPTTGQPKPGFDRASALVLLGPGFLPGVVRIRDATTGHLISRLPHGVGATHQADLFA